MVEAPCRGDCTYGSDAARQLCWSLCGHVKRGSGWRMAIGSSRMFVVAPRRKILPVKLRVCRPLPGTRESVHSSTRESRRGEKERSGRCGANWQNRKSAEYELSSCAKVQCGGIESESRDSDGPFLRMRIEGRPVVAWLRSESVEEEDEVRSQRYQVTI